MACAMLPGESPSSEAEPVVGEVVLEVVVSDREASIASVLDDLLATQGMCAVMDTALEGSAVAAGIRNEGGLEVGLAADLLVHTVAVEVHHLPF